MPKTGITSGGRVERMRQEHNGVTVPLQLHPAAGAHAVGKCWVKQLVVLPRDGVKRSGELRA